MKTTIAFLFLSAALPLCAADSGKINDAERAYLLDQLEQSKKGMLASIQGLSDAQWRFKPAPTVWSVQECAEHIILAEEYIFGGAMQTLKTPAVERLGTSNLEHDKVLFSRITDRSQKATAPEPLVPGQKFATPADAAREFTARRAKTIDYVKTTGDDLRAHVSDGPVGKMDSYQFLILLASHSVRHTEQIKEVEANAAYPKAGVAGGAAAKYLVAYSLMPGLALDKMAPAQLATLQAHGAYMIGQMKKGVLVWGGRTTDPVHPHGYVELSVPSAADAQAYIDGDPAVKAGIFRCTFEQFSEIPRQGM